MNALVCAVERDNEIHIPKGDFTLHLGDKVTIAADAADLVKLIKNLKVYSPKAQRVMIVGGSRTAAYLAQRRIRNAAAGNRYKRQRHGSKAAAERRDSVRGCGGVADGHR